jgi:hypothetical protein
MASHRKKNVSVEVDFDEVRSILDDVSSHISATSPDEF